MPDPDYDRDSQTSCCLPLPSLDPVHIESLSPSQPIITSSPFISPLIFANNASDARDHCANERNFLSWLRLSIYLCIVSIAVLLRFSLKVVGGDKKPSTLESKVSLPLGIIFWVLSLICLANGVGNYGRTVMRYARNSAIVQSGGKTRIVMCLVSVVIAGSCVIFLVNSASQ